MDTKVCSKCKRELPLTTKYFHRDCTQASGFKCKCKECACLESRKYGKENRDKIRGKEAVYREQNRDKFRAKYRRNREKTKEQKRELNKLRHKVYYQSHKEQYKKDQTERRKRNPEINKIQVQRRNAKKRLLPASLTTKQWGTCLEYFYNKCCYCGKEDSLTQDHFVPISQGGEYAANNIVPCCKSCNPSKSNKDFFEWYPKQPFYSKQREAKILKYLNYEGNIQQLALTI
jgi:hypothetical protein